MIQTVEKAIRAQLAASSEVSSLVGARIYSTQAPANAALPLIVYQVTGGGSPNDSPRDALDLIVTIRATATDAEGVSGAASAKAAADVIRAALHNVALALDAPWNAYDIQFRSARFKNGKLVEKPRVTVYFNGTKAHTNVEIQQVWGGANSGIDGGNEKGKGITETPGGIKLQCEGHDVRFRNIWIKEMVIEKPETDFSPQQ